ncbi:MAG TPA: DUF3107 domain-containing protein [Pseudonocardiaceae bacterium]|nr:DUF3107 domain-containing protein [Pseudonocardiaceae bacterium]
MEIKIGVAESPRELVLSSTLTPDEVEKLVSDALKKDEGVLSITDEKGRRIVVPVSRIAYVDIAPADVRRVGFVAGS